MNEPFVFLDNKNKKIHIVINTLCKTISFSDLESNDDFFYELNRKFSNYEMFTLSQNISKKDFRKLIDDLTESEKVIEKRQVQTEKEVEKSAEDNESSFIMSTTPTKFFIEELGMEFKMPGDHYNLDNYEDKDIEKSQTFKFFIDKGYLKRASLSTIRKTKEAYITERRNKKDARSMIIDRDNIGIKRSGDEPETIDIGSEPVSRTSKASNLDPETQEAIDGFFDSSDEAKFLDPSLRGLLDGRK